MAGPAIVGEVKKEGRAVGGAYVRLVGPSGEFVSEQYTGDDGRFRFHVAPGSWTIEVRAAASDPQREVVEVSSAEQPVEILLS